MAVPAEQGKLFFSNAKNNYSVEERMEGFNNLQHFIESKIKKKETFFIGRLSGDEARLCGLVLSGKANQHMKCAFGRPMLETMSRNAGIMVTSQKSLKTYVHCNYNAVRNCDMLGVWAETMYLQAVEFYHFAKKQMPQKPIFHSCALEPFYFFQPSKYNTGVDNYRLYNLWSGKRLLVISSHINTIKQQIKHIDKVFEPYKIFDKNVFSFVCPPKTMSFNHENKDWMEDFEGFKKRVAEHDFDIALVSCGGYGMPICDYIYSTLGKSCMYIGGALQLFFGITGKRWLDHETLKDYYNEYWRRPLDIDRPPNSHLIEGGCYW